MILLIALLSFGAGALVSWLLISARQNQAAASAAPASAAVVPAEAELGNADAMRAPDPELDAEIFAYVSENDVFHINDVCSAIEHPKGARFVRTHFHQLMERGEIRYTHMRYRV